MVGWINIKSARDAGTINQPANTTSPIMFTGINYLLIASRAIKRVGQLLKDANTSVLRRASIVVENLKVGTLKSTAKKSVKISGPTKKVNQDSLLVVATLGARLDERGLKHFSNTGGRASAAASRMFSFLHSIISMAADGRIDPRQEVPNTLSASTRASLETLSVKISECSATTATAGESVTGASALIPESSLKMYGPHLMEWSNSRPTPEVVS